MKKVEVKLTVFEDSNGLVKTSYELLSIEGGVEDDEMFWGRVFEDHGLWPTDFPNFELLANAKTTPGDRTE